MTAHSLIRQDLLTGTKALASEQPILDVSLPSSDKDAKPVEADPPRAFRVAVRTLSEFTGRSGDLDRRMGPSPNARQGLAGHQIVARRRAPGHEFELPLEFLHGPVRVVGRIDIFDPVKVELEEVKTGFGPPGQGSSARRSAHRAQLRIYGGMLCAARGLERIRLSLVHYDLLDDSEHRESEDVSAATLIAELIARCERYRTWALQELEHRARRDRWLSGLAWPFDSFRPGQHELAASVYRSARDATLLRILAPTGLGKTLGTIFPALRSMPDSGMDRLFYLTAKGTGRPAALHALGRLLEGPPASPPPIRIIELVARERSCEYPDRECHGSSCPLAQAFFDKLPAAREAAMEIAVLDQARIRRLALRHGLCPYHLAIEILPSADVVVGDYNYWFDRHALLFGLALEHRWDVMLLIDEAHHLTDRSRSMYSAALSLGEFEAARQSGSGVDRMIDQWDLLLSRSGSAPSESSTLLEDLPAAWLRALKRWVRQIARRIEAGDPLIKGDLLALYLRCLSFVAMADQFGDHSLCELRRDSAVSVAPHPDPILDLKQVPGSTATLRLCNIVPAPFVRDRLTQVRCVVMFSATLHPDDFDQAMLGWTRPHRTLSLAPPFDPSRLQVRTLGLSTRFDQRQGTIDRIVTAMARQFRDAPGCYIAFFSSFDYMELAATRLSARHPDIPIRAQPRVMNEAERAQFVDAFDPEHPALALAVLGGVFSEGMDLPGRRLIGAFVVTLGMPRVDPLNEATAARLEALFGRGFDYTYLYPGLCKVIQAAGRVIRDSEDQGVVILIDARWRKARYRALLPVHWGLSPSGRARATDRIPPRPPALPNA
jgi:DNA excision repair protein ERCC-2